MFEIVLDIFVLNCLACTPHSHLSLLGCVKFHLNSCVAAAKVCLLAGTYVTEERKMWRIVRRLARYAGPQGTITRDSRTSRSLRKRRWPLTATLWVLLLFALVARELAAKDVVLESSRFEVSTDESTRCRQQGPKSTHSNRSLRLKLPAPHWRFHWRRRPHSNCSTAVTWPLAQRRADVAGDSAGLDASRPGCGRSPSSPPLRAGAPRRSLARWACGR